MTSHRTRPADPHERDLVRVPVWLWHLPSTLFILGVVVVALLSEDVPIGIGWATAAATVTVLASGVANLAQRRPSRSATEAAVPALLLLAAGMVHVSSHGSMHSTLLLAGVPIAWLAFTFGLAGTLAAAAATAAIAGAPYLATSGWPTTPLERWDAVLPAAALVGMAAVTYRAGRLFVDAQEAVAARTTALQREVSTTRAMVASADAAIIVFVVDEPPQLSSEAVDMCRRAGVTELDPDAVNAFVGAGVRDADRDTETAPAAQAIARASRGETYADLVQWVGTGTDHRAMVCSSSSILTANGSSVGTVFVAWDATELLDSVRVREEFLGTVGHELRTPLAAITGYLELYTEDADDHLAGNAYVTAAARHVEALSDRIEDLLEAAVPRRISSTPTDVVPLVRAMVAAHHAHASGADLSMTVSTPARLVADVNPGAFSEILRNLLSNAVKHAQHGEVVVSIESLGAKPEGAAGQGVTLTVEDTGVGMTDREAQRVFDRFYRTEETIRRVVPGLGVGLTVTRQLVLAHRGTITVHSTPGVGSRFRITIPAALPESAATN